VGLNTLAQIFGYHFLYLKNIVLKLELTLRLWFFIGQSKSGPAVVNATHLMESDLNLMHPNHTFRMVYTNTGTTRATAATSMLRAAMDEGALAVVGDFSSR
jgi:hypothetical protein